MAVHSERFSELLNELSVTGAQLVAVSKTKTPEEIHELYVLGQKDFGENYVQELIQKRDALPEDIRWHFIGHLQSNKVKLIAPFVHLIQGVDSIRLLKEINRQGTKLQRIINVLLQVHIATEESKFGFNSQELREGLNEAEQLAYVRVRGLMGMASFVNDQKQVIKEFMALKGLFDDYKDLLPGFDILSMGMSGDYKLALEAGSNMVRIGSLLFGERA